MTRTDLCWALGVFVAGGIIISATMPLMGLLGLQTTERGVRRLAEFSAGMRVAMVLTAGVTEEIRYRGYLVERLYQLTGRLGLSAALSWLAFLVVHIPSWTLGGAIQIGLASVVLYLLYVKRRNLPACMLAHILNHIVALFVVPALLPRASP